jgi:hypothetical protein
MGYAFTDVRAVIDDVCALNDACAVTDVGRPPSAPHSGRPIRRDP